MIRALVLTAVLFTLAACSGTQHSWRVDTDASLTVAAHALAAADAVVADQYTTASQLPGVDLAALDRRVAPFVEARGEARTALLSAESALATGGCDAAVALRLASVGMAHVAEALGRLDARVPAIAEAASALTLAIANGPTCPTGGL